MLNRIPCILLLFLAGAIAPPAWERMLDDQQYDDAARNINRRLVQTPDDPELHYALARALAMTDQHGDAAASLVTAIENGFRDFARMQAETDFQPIHDHPTYTAILEAAARVAASRATTDPRKGAPTHASEAAASLEDWKTRFGEDAYRFHEDPDRHLTFAVALDATADREMRDMLSRQADQMAAMFFGAPPNDTVLIAIPTPAHVNQLIDNPAVGGFYQHDKRRLIARDIGRTLRHEFFHAYHYGDMERRRQSHALWIQEGLASLYEDYDLDESGAITFLPNDRHNIARRQVRASAALRWRDLASMPPNEFFKRGKKIYPQVRSIFEFVAAQGRLPQWYRAYIETFDRDPTGLTAFEVVFEQPLDDIERNWRSWLSSRPPVDDVVSPGDASLGINLGADDAVDGARITGFTTNSAARAAGLRRGDVIVAVDDKPTRSASELRTTIAEHDVGDIVRIRVRRNDAYDTVSVKLRALRVR